MPTSCPVSWPLPAISNRSPSLQHVDLRRGWRGRGRLFPAAPGAAARICARIAAGSSLRGLSSVTIDDVGAARRDLAHDRALAGVAVAAAAEHHDQAIPERKAAGRRAPFPARRACARNRRKPARRSCRRRAPAVPARRADFQAPRRLFRAARPPLRRGPPRPAHSRPGTGRRAAGFTSMSRPS